MTASPTGPSPAAPSSAAPFPAPAPGTPAPGVVRGDLVVGDTVVRDGAVVVSGDQIAWVGPATEVPAQWRDAPAPEGWRGGSIITPGLIDLHSHGAAGAEIGRPEPRGIDPDPDDDPVASRERAARRVVAHHRAAGTTSFVASLVSALPDELELGVRALARLCARGELAGIHLEGPFLSEARRGAQNPVALSDAAPGLVTRLAEAAAQEGAPGSLVQMTLAPERDLDGAMPQALVAAGALPALGHTDADVNSAQRLLATARELAANGGVRGGRPLVTHLFNGMPPLHHRRPGPVAAALQAAGRGEAIVELIGDGTHLAPETMSMVFDLVGAENVVLVSDAMSACGMPPGTYELGGQEVEVRDGAARLTATDSLAGSVATVADCLRFTVTRAGVDLAAAVTAATATPAVVLDGPGTLRGTLAAGAPADLVGFTADLHVTSVIAAGQPVRPL